MAEIFRCCFTDVSFIIPAERPNQNMSDQLTEIPHSSVLVLLYTSRRGVTEFHDLYSSPNIISDQVKEYEMGRACSTKGGE
jgi:hypothetical protein